MKNVRKQVTSLLLIIVWLVFHKLVSPSLPLPYQL